MAPSLSERDEQVIWHPYTAQNYGPPPIPVVKGQGAWLFDEHGARYLDAVSSWWVTVHGHAHPYIAERIYRQALQLEQVIFAGFTHQPAVELAERLLAILPGDFSKVFYSDNGSTATEVAVKMAIQYWWNKGEKKRTRILALTGGYHGDTFGAMSISGRSVFTLAFREHLFDVLFANVPASGEKLVIEGHPPEQTEHLLQECACIIYEPLLQGAGGMLMYSPEQLNTLLHECRKHGLLCIADEVMTGFGRTGKLFASEHGRHAPDIICLSKGLTGGTLALGVTACTAQVHSAFASPEKLKIFFHGHSFTANPLACSAALASLDLFDRENTLDRIGTISEKHRGFAGHLNSNTATLGISNVRQTGTVLAFEVNSHDTGYTSDIRDRVTQSMLKKGVYLRPLGNTIYLMPPYCVTDNDLETIYSSLRETLHELRAENEN